MTKHSPGPWHVHPRYAFWVEDADGHGVADLEGRGGVETAKANARLIAAAPDLLAACEQAVKTLELWPESEWGWREHQVYDALTAAIAKARP